MLVFFFARCEKIKVESDPYFFNGKWTTHLSGKNTTWLICFDITNRILNDSYFCNQLMCSDWNSDYTLELFEFRSYDSTLLIKIRMNIFGNYMYYGTYNKEKDIFIGPTYWNPADQPSAYFMRSNNDSTIRRLFNQN